MKVPQTMREAMRDACVGPADTAEGQAAFLAGVVFSIFHMADSDEAGRLQDEAEEILGEMIHTDGAA